MKKKSKDWKGLLGIAEGKVNYRYMGEQPRQGYLVNPRVGMTRLSWAVWGKWEEKGEEREGSEAA